MKCCDAIADVTRRMKKINKLQPKKNKNYRQPVGFSYKKFSYKN